ncbi:hypothetical protein AHAS_Ahas02G0158600 [Arachis hypogaea]
MEKLSKFWLAKPKPKKLAPCSNYQEPSSFYPCQEPPSDIETSQKKSVMENKLMTQQLSLLTQQMSGMQVPTINTQHLNFEWGEQPQRPQNFNHSSQGVFQQNNSNNYQFQSSQSQQNNDLEAILKSFMQEIRASIRNLEVQMSQISKQLEEEEDAQPPILLVSNEEEIALEESYQEEEVEIEKACKEVEEFKEEHKGVELAKPPSRSNYDK